MTEEEKSINQQFYDYDKRGVRPFVRYSNAMGGWAIECYRKKLKSESEGEHDWKMERMIREGVIQSYESRPEAEIKALEFAEEICKQYGY